MITFLPAIQFRALFVNETFQFNFFFFEESYNSQQYTIFRRARRARAPNSSPHTTMALDSTHIESLRRPESNVYLCCHAKRAALSHTTSTSFNSTKIYYEERKTCSRRLDDNVKTYSCQQCHTYREISSSSHSGDNTKNPILV